MTKIEEPVLRIKLYPHYKKWKWEVHIKRLDRWISNATELEWFKLNKAGDFPDLYNLSSHRTVEGLSKNFESAEYEARKAIAEIVSKVHAYNKEQIYKDENTTYYE